jgi:hypothetical protein
VAPTKSNERRMSFDCRTTRSIGIALTCECLQIRSANRDQKFWQVRERSPYWNIGAPHLLPDYIRIS